MGKPEAPEVALQPRAAAPRPLHASSGASFGGGLLIPFPGTGGWTELPPNDDGFSGLTPLGFEFEFYGTAYSEVCVNNNGNVSFTGGASGCFSTFTPTGFPSPDFTMVAPFWADVDTRCETCGLTYYKQILYEGIPAFVAHWEAVGYYSSHDDKVNTFQVVITDTAVLPGGSNVCLGYGEMMWTTGDASGGVDGFGGTPATVGANAGNGDDYFLIGRFDHEGTDYDGPEGNVDGVSFLDNTQACFNTGASAENVPPVLSGFSDGEVFTVAAGESFQGSFGFLSPEIGQTTTISVDAGVLANFSWEASPGNPATADLTFSPNAAQVGEHQVMLTAMDNGNPPLTTTASIIFAVTGASAAVEVTVEGEPEVDSEAVLRVAVAGFTPSAADLFYRLGGQSTYASVPLAASGAGTYTVSIPASAVTLRGVDYYFVLSDGIRTITFPAANPTANPLHLIVTVSSVVSSASPPPDGSYRMVSVPLTLGDASAAAVFTDDYGDYDPALWRLLRWLPGQARYAEFPNLGTDLTPGTALWLATRTTVPFDAEGGQSVDASGPVTLTLAPGWSQIASPFAFPVAWSAIEGSSNAGVPEVWDGAEYQQQGVLAPWAGAFVLNPTGEPLTLTVNPVEASPGERVAAQVRTGYGLRLIAEAAPGETGYRDGQNLAAFAEEAEPGRDRFDRAEAPPPGEHLRLSFLPDEPAGTEPYASRLAHSVQPDAGEGAVWELEVTATPALLQRGALPVTVRLVDEGTRPDGYGVHVLDLDRVTALATAEGAFTVTLAAHEPVRRLRLIVGTDGFAEAASQGLDLVPLAYALHPAYPNPTRRSATIGYQLAEATPVRLEVYDLLGRRVAVLVEGEQDAGRHARVWATQGLASGVYIYRLRAGSFSDTGKLLLIR
ncbi:MAG: T9SS type A sorting domain-containing protein [Rhodothermaceae bacterium]|nr:T9SS type A sorting domain-containing protein [Rhodothermaceae bacterium]